MTRRSTALWNLGFRPFYLLASAFAALSVPYWVAVHAGWMPAPPLPGPVWHAHEMLFGFTMAVLAGFLFTAVRTWTNRPTPTGRWLIALAALWLAGRVLVLTPYSALAAVATAAFPLAVAAGIGIPLFASGNRRNYFFIALLVGLSIATLGAHLAQMEAISLPPWAGLKFGLDIVLFILAVMGGRVIPMFTNNGVPGTNARRQRGVETAALGGLLLLIAADALAIDGPAVAVLLTLLAAAHVWRLALWKPWKTWRVPLVWSLHAAYAWIPVHLMLRILAEADLLPSPAATHALTVGAIGGLTMAMMTRTAKGHTGVPLRADRHDVACYALVLGSAIVRVFAPLSWPGLYASSVLASAALWSLAFALYAVRYWPLLTQPRRDGRPG